MRNTWWTTAGRYFGYPECCITDFVRRFGEATPTQVEAGQGTGFIPCPRCAALVVGSPDPPARLRALITERQARHQFPRSVRGELDHLRDTAPGAQGRAHSLSRNHNMNSIDHLLSHFPHARLIVVVDEGKVLHNPTSDPRVVTHTPDTQQADRDFAEDVRCTVVSDAAPRVVLTERLKRYPQREPRPLSIHDLSINLIRVADTVVALQDDGRGRRGRR